MNRLAVLLLALAATPAFANGPVATLAQQQGTVLVNQGEVFTTAVDHQREMLAMLTEAWSVADRTAALERFYETDLLPLAEQSVHAALLAYRSNRAMIDDVIAARRTAPCSRGRQTACLTQGCV